MKTKRFHNVSLKTKEQQQVSTGLNTQLLLDGKPLKGVKSAKIEVFAGGIAKVTLEMVGKFDAELNVDKIYIKEPKKKLSRNPKLRKPKKVAKKSIKYTPGLKKIILG